VLCASRPPRVVRIGVIACVYISRQGHSLRILVFLVRTLYGTLGVGEGISGITARVMDGDGYAEYCDGVDI